MSPSRDQDERAARSLGALVNEAASVAEAARRASVTARRSDLAIRQKLADALQSGRPSSWVERWVELAKQISGSVFGRRAALVLAFGALAVVVAFAWGGRKLGYHIDGASEVAGYVRAEGRSVALRFDDGSSFSFRSGSSGRVSEVGAHGAAVTLEDGVVEASVVHRSGAAWSALAGPWEVRVTGTRFDLAWDPRTHALRVDLWDGRVIVRGPGAEEGIALHAGQSLRAQDGEGIHVADLERSASSDAARTGAPSAAPAPSVASPSAPSADVAPSASAALAPSASGEGAPDKRPVDRSRISWPELVAKGSHEVVLAEARDRGIAQVLGSAPSSDLLALADAARYGGDGSLASRALQALRDRYAGSKAAADAAFLLGRMADDGGSAASAIRWYDVHMAEGGAFSQEALGRKMIAVRRSSGDAAARAVARQYLDRYPHGPHAPVARALTEGDVGLGASPGPR